MSATHASPNEIAAFEEGIAHGRMDGDKAIARVIVEIERRIAQYDAADEADMYAQISADELRDLLVAIQEDN